jgi:hypothetical protein
MLAPAVTLNAVWRVVERIGESQFRLHVEFTLKPTR